jgi:hypothetical protein
VPRSNIQNKKNLKPKDAKKDLKVSDKEGNGMFWLKYSDLEKYIDKLEYTKGPIPEKGKSVTDPTKPSLEEQNKGGYKLQPNEEELILCYNPRGANFGRIGLDDNNS